MDNLPITTGLAPIVNSDARLLILGSLPSVQSVQKQQYYGNPNNHFWSIMEAVLGERLPQPYADRIAMLQRHGVAVWDVLHSAQRKGSLDSNIRKEQANDLPGLLQRYPDIQQIVLNGGKAAQSYHKHFPQLALPYAVVRSSSPIPSQSCNTLAEKIVQWRSAMGLSAANGA